MGDYLINRRWGLPLFVCLSVFLITATSTKEEEEGGKRKKDEEREVPDPQESIEDTLS